METEPKPQFTIATMTQDDVGEANEMRMQSWLDTYPNAEAGITREWVESQRDRQLSDQAREDRRIRFDRDMANGAMAAWVARDKSGVIIGSTTPYVDTDGVQHVGSMYVAKEWQRRGVGSALMQKVIDWCSETRPIELEVAAYNEQARVFYRKWGFVDVNGSEKLHREKIPVIKMIREATK